MLTLRNAFAALAVKIPVMHSTGIFHEANYQSIDAARCFQRLRDGNVVVKKYGYFLIETECFESVKNTFTIQGIALRSREQRNKIF